MAEIKKQTLLHRLKERSALVAIVIWFSIMWSWPLFTDVLDLAGSKTQGYLLAVFVVTLNVAITTTVIWQAVRLLKHIHETYSSKWLLALGLPLFAFADFLACWLTAIIWIGPQGQVDSVLPMGSLALLLVNTPLKFAARFVGFYGLAALLWFFLYLVVQKNTRRLAILPLALVVVLAGLGWALYQPVSGKTIKVTLVSEKLTNRVPVINGHGSDLVVFPEYGLDKVNQGNLKERIIRTDYKSPKTYFLGSEQIYSTSFTGHINNMKFGNSTDGVTKTEYKWRLIPGGEDLPVIVRILLRATGQKSTLNYFSYAKGVIKGKQQLKPFIINKDIHVAAAVCSSIISPQDYRDFTRSGATVFTNSASLTTFRGSPVFAWQQESLGRFMAVANARYFLQSANAAKAYAIDTDGNKIAEASGIETLNVVARTNAVKTFYTQAGEWLVYGGSICAVGLMYISLRKKR